MANRDASNAEIMFKLRFIKLGFDERKSKAEKFDREAIKERLEKINLVESGSMPLQSMTIDEVKEETQRVISNLYQGVSLKVDVFQDELERQNQDVVKEYNRLNTLYRLGKITIADVTDKMLIAYKRNAKKAKVFDIPVKPVNGMDSMQGQTLKGPLMIIGDVERMAKNAPVYMESISLGDRYDKLSIGTYTHEITHILIDRHKGVVENYYNDEFLSIFMEKVAVDQIDNTPNKFLVKCSEIYRLAHVKKLLNDLENCKEGTSEYKDKLKYIQSSLYAGILFDRYSQGDEPQKQAILEQIKAILNGKAKLNDFIKNQQLSLDNEEVFKYLDKVEGYTSELAQGRKTNIDFEESEMSSESMQVNAIIGGDKIAADLLPEENVQKKDE